MPAPRPSKDEKYWRLLSGACSLDVQRGHLAWSLSELSRTASVTRSLIYHYFGGSKLDILLAAVDIIGQDIIGLSEDRLQLWSANRIADSILATRAILQRVPELLTFYYLRRAADDVIGRRLRELERAQRQKIQQHLSHLSEAEVEAIYAMLMGLSIAPDITEDSVRWGVAQLQRSLHPPG